MIPEALSQALSDRYRIERELGVGGMATVYLAHDIRHDRKVAVKVLRPELAAVIGAERFLSEIKTTANLQHPHILPLFDSGAVNGTVFYVMPFVAGESLRDRLTREKQLPLNEAVGIAREVASALDYAHRNGIIHRDIKPENILLHDRRALVADFGIALAAKSADQRMTETGMSLGTPQYMSPEQAMGDRELDARSDVFALGCVTYEMLVGEPPFAGPTAQAIVAKIITDQPKPPSASRRSVPASLDFAVLTSLEKLPADRWTSADEFSRALAGEDVGGRMASVGTGVGSRMPVRTMLVGAVGVAVIAAGLGWFARGDRGAPPLVFGQSRSVTSSPGLEILPAISPDGRSVAFAMGTWNTMQIHVRPVSGGRAIRLTNDTLSVQSAPSWSPDGSRVMFVANGGAFSAPASGGVARQEVPASRTAPLVWAAWAPDGKRIAYAAGDSLMLHNAEGRSRTLATMLEPNLCHWSPSGAHIVCAAGNAAYASSRTFFANLAPSRIVVCRVDDGTLTTVSDSSSLNHSPVWSPDGRWVYFVSNRFGGRDVYGQRLTRGAEADGMPVRLTTGLSAHSISLTPDGRHLAYALLDATSNVWSMPIPDGRATSLAGLRQETFGSQAVEGINVSRDGQWLYFDSNLSGNSDLYRARLPQGEQEQLTFDASDEFNGVPSPDGREVSFHSFRTGSRDVFVMPLDGGAVQSVTNSPLQEAAADWKPDGSALAFMELVATGGIWIVSRNADGAWGTAVKRLAYGVGPVWSPDGTSLAILSRFGGKVEIVPADAGPPRVLLDPERPGEPGAQSVRFSADGKTVFAKSLDAQGRATIWSVPFAGGTPQLRVVFDDPNRSSNNPRWALSATQLYFTIDDWQSDIRVLAVIGK